MRYSSSVVLKEGFPLRPPSLLISIGVKRCSSRRVCQPLVCVDKEPALGGFASLMAGSFCSLRPGRVLVSKKSGPVVRALVERTILREENLLSSVVVDGRGQFRRVGRIDDAAGGLIDTVCRS